MSQQGPKAVLYDEANNALLGQQTMALSLPVVIASDQGPVIITTDGGNPLLVLGTLKHNTDPDDATDIGALVGLANAAAPVLVEGNRVLLSTDLSGHLRVAADTLPLPAGAATEASLAAQSLVDNAAFTDGTSRVQPAGFVFDEVSGTALTENDIAAARVDSKRAQVFVIEDATTRGQKASVNAGGELNVTSTVANNFLAGIEGETSAIMIAQTDGSQKTQVTDVIPGTAATNLGKAEDAAHASGDVGVMALAVQKAAPADLGADGDYGPLQVSAGRLWTSAVIPVGATSIAKAEDAASANGDVGVPAMAIQSSAPSDGAGSNLDYSILQMSGGRLWASTIVTAQNTSIGKAEDVASADADVGVPAMAIQKATPADTAGTDGDYAMLQMSAGRLWTSTVVPAAAASIAKAEDVASADADVGVPAMAIRKATPANTSGTDGDYEMLQMSAGRLWASATIDAALPAGANSIGTVDTELPAAAALADAASAAPTTPTVGNIPLLKNFGGTVDRQIAIQIALDSAGTGIAAAGLIAQLDDVSPIGVTENNFSALRMSTRRVLYTEGPTAADGVMAANPHTIGGRAATANPTAVAGADVVNTMHDKLGKQVVIPVTVRELVTDATTTISASTAETTILAAGAAGVFHDLCALTIANTSATDARVDIRSATAGSVRFSWLVPAGSTVGAVFHVPVTQTASANNWTAQSSASVTDLRIFAQAAKNL